MHGSSLVCVCVCVRRGKEGTVTVSLIEQLNIYVLFRSVKLRLVVVLMLYFILAASDHVSETNNDDMAEVGV